MPSRDKGSKYWLFIEPYIHIASSPGGVLFYNTLSGKRLEYSQSEVIKKIGSLLNKPENGYVIPLNASEVNRDEIRNLIADLRTCFMGDLLETRWSTGKPSNIFPSPMVKAKLTPKILQKPDRLKEIEFDNYLHEVYVYLNTGNDTAGPFAKAPFQFFSPFLNHNDAGVLSVDNFTQFIYQADTFKIVTLNISGNNIFEYPDLDKIISLSDSYRFRKKYHIRVPDHEKYFSILEDIAKRKDTTLSFYITFPLDLVNLNHVLEFISSRSLARKSEFHFLVTNDMELQASRDMIEQGHLHPVFFKPYYTGNNFSFFKNTIFITQEDIKHSKPDQFQVFSRISINEKDFGRLTLMPDGTVFANVIDAQLGSIADESLSNLVLRALIHGKSWKRNRKNVTPCRNCMYHFLCPPISSYEILMRRYNFCDIYKKPRYQ